MPLCLIFALVWGMLAGSARVMPKQFLLPAAWVLIGTGIPLLGFMTIQVGPVVGVAGLVAAVLLLSWAVSGLGRVPPTSAGEF